MSAATFRNTFARAYQNTSGRLTEADVINALRDDREQQIKALQAELKCASKLIGKPMLSADIETLRRNWALLIGEEA